MTEEEIAGIHTTPMGAERIKRNLGLTADPVEYCKERIRRADIARKGKNLYAVTDGEVITINACSRTIITAHRLNIREITGADVPRLADFLYLAIFQPQEDKLPRRVVYEDPNLSIYIKAYGQTHDNGVLAEENGQTVGMAWTRRIQAFGYLDEQTPELAVALLPSARGRGIGTKLMEGLFGLLKKKGYERTSLAVQKENPAVRFYQRLGYETVQEKAEEYLMVKELNR